MRPRFIAPLILALFTLSACSTVDAVAGATAGSVASVAPQVTNAVKKALTAAHDLHKSAAVFLTIAAQTNLCHAACATGAKSLLDQSEAILVAGDKLVVLGDAPGIEAKITAATALISQAQSLIGKK